MLAANCEDKPLYFCRAPSNDHENTDEALRQRTATADDGTRSIRSYEQSITRAISTAQNYLLHRKRHEGT
jgi:hypothetical protein